jgi:hypothetical protein
VKFRVEHDLAPLELDLAGDHGFDDADVSFDRGRTPWSRPKRLLFVVGVAILLGGGAMVLADDEPARSGPVTSPTIPSAGVSPVTTIASPTTLPVTATPAPTTVVPEYLRPVSLPEDPGWRVYLTDGFDLTVFDPWSGRATELPQRRDVAAVVPGPRNAVILQYGTLDVDTTFVGDGTAWALIGDSLVRRTVADRSVTERVDLPAGWVPTPLGQVLVGTDAAARPVVVGVDQRAYAVGADSTLTRISDGAVLAQVQGGQFAEGICTDAGACVTTLRGTAGALEVQLSGPLYSVGFSPLGTHAATLEWPTFRIFDLAVGEVGRFEFAEEAFPFQSGLASGWSPDGRFLFFVFVGRLFMFDSATNGLSDLAAVPRPEFRVVGVATP